MSKLFKISQKYFTAHDRSDYTGKCDIINFLRFQVQGSLSQEIVFGLVSAFLLKTFLGPCKSVSHGNLLRLSC